MLLIFVLFVIFLIICKIEWIWLIKIRNIMLFMNIINKDVILDLCWFKIVVKNVVMRFNLIICIILIWIVFFIGRERYF